MARTDVAEAVAEAMPAEDAGEQLELMPPTRTNLAPQEVERIDAAVKRDRAGRPPGAKNKTTREMLDYIRRWCGDPLERRFRWAMHTPETLSIELGCTKLEALTLLLKLWGELERYFYATLAQVDGEGNAVRPWLTMNIGGQHAHLAATDPSKPPWIIALEQLEQNQRLIEPAGAVSHGQGSHEGGNDNDTSGLASPGG